VVNGNGGEEVRPPAIGPLARAGRGAFNMLISPLEIPATMGRVASEKDAFFGLWAGGIEGLGNGLVRLCAGFVELVTSPIPSDRPPLYSKQLGERAFPPLRPPRNITRP
jgi:putative exosortase-associated protein (TIGR04073 family)